MHMLGETMVHQEIGYGLIYERKAHAVGLAATARAIEVRTSVERRFAALKDLVASDESMKDRHPEWLILEVSKLVLSTGFHALGRSEALRLAYLVHLERASADMLEFVAAQCAEEEADRVMRIHHGQALMLFRRYDPDERFPIHEIFPPAPGFAPLMARHPGVRNFIGRGMGHVDSVIAGAARPEPEGIAGALAAAWNEAGLGLA